MASGFSPSGLQKLGDFFSDSILVTCHFLLPYAGFFLDPIIFIRIMIGSKRFQAGFALCGCIVAAYNFPYQK
jgi:hypothetical protein